MSNISVTNEKMSPFYLQHCFAKKNFMADMHCLLILMPTTIRNQSQKDR